MHRTQILLDYWQYDALKARAAREGVSMSALLREMITRQLRAPAERCDSGLAGIEGIGEDDGADGREHDRVLYASRTDE